MPNCGCSKRCTCSVVAGPGVEVDGNGSTSNPYVISAPGSGGTVALQAADTPTVDTTVTGSGAAGDPFLVSGAVILDPAPPAGGSNLVHAGPDGLYVECADVRTCLTAGPGVDYDQVTGTISAEPTVVEAGTNVTVTGTGSTVDPYVVSAAGGGGVATVVEAGDGVTVTGTGSAADPYVVAADPITCDDVRPCLSAGPGATYNPATGVIGALPTIVQAGTNVTVTGTGSSGDPYVVSSAGGGGVATVVEAGDRVTVTGTGSAADPYVVAADPVTCDDVRPCLVAGPGVDYDVATGTISAEGTVVQAGTGTTVTGAGTTADPYEVSTLPPETGCGLTGDGTIASPLAAAVSAWAYPCPVDANAGRVYCDSTGTLRSEPRGQVAYQSDQQVLDVADLTVPAAQDTEVATHTVSITNPDPCRPAFLQIEAEVDADINLPAGAGAGFGISTDETWYSRNTGTTAALDTHAQATKVLSPGTVAAGATINYTVSIRMGRGSNGATYNRVQSFIRATLIIL